MQAHSETLQFSRFRLEPRRRVLLADGAPVALSSRAYDLLEFLVRNRDRVVTRDEIVAHVWGGMAVGENNLSVQMSLLRRALAEHAGKETLIVNLPGRGYRFVGDVDAATPLPPPVGLEVPAIALAKPPAVIPVAGRLRRTWLVATGGILVVLILILLVTLAGLIGWLPPWSEAKLPDARLSIAVPEFRAVGNDPRTPALAADYTQAILARFGQFGDIVLFPDPEPVRPKVPAHFLLNGSVQVNGSDAVVMTELTELATGKLLYRSNVAVPADATVFKQTATAMEMFLDMRPSLFRAEFALRKGPPRDSLDLVIEAHVAVGKDDQPSQAVALAEQAVQRDPSSVPARVLLSTFLTDQMLLLPATNGDAAGRRALHLIDSVLQEQPRNFLFIDRRAYTLEALGQIDEAEATAELGLNIDPAYYGLVQTLGEVSMLKGDLAKAKALIMLNPRDIGDDRIATLAFAEGRYPDAVVLSRKIIAAAPAGWNMRWTALLEIAALSQLGKAAEAKSLLMQWIPAFPEELRHVKAQRQAFHLLPDVAWLRFKQGLAEAGMPP